MITNTGEQGFHQEEQALTIVSQYMPVISPCQHYPETIAERIVRDSLASGRRESMNETAIAERAITVMKGLTELTQGWNNPAKLTNMNAKTGVVFISDEGNYELDNPVVVFVELPEASFTRRVVGRFCALRFMPEVADFGGRSFKYPTTEKNGRVYLDSMNIPFPLLDGIVKGFPDLLSAQYAMDDLTDALRVLRSATNRRRMEEMSESERAVLQYEADQRRLERLASAPKAEPTV